MTKVHIIHNDSLPLLKGVKPHPLPSFMTQLLFPNQSLPPPLTFLNHLTLNAYLVEGNEGKEIED